MDCWIVALRGGEDALVDARAVFGAPAAQIGTVEVYVFETADVATAARPIGQLQDLVRGGIAGGVALDDGALDEARERAVALALSAADGELLFDPPSHARLNAELIFVRPRARPRWTLPTPAVALAPVAARRASCRDGLARTPADPALCGREDEINAVIALAQQPQPDPIIVRAPLGWGGGRIIAEAAARLGRTMDRVPAAAHVDAESLWRAIAAMHAGDWLVIDPVTVTLAPLMRRVFKQIARTRQLVLRVELDVELPFIGPSREVAVPPLRREEARALVRAVLGPQTPEGVVRRIARRAGFVPRRVVEMVRGAIQLGELVAAPDGGWRVRARRALGTLGSHGDPLAARVNDLPPLLSRALTVVAAVGDGAREVEVLAAMRGTLSQAPEQLLGALEALRLVAFDGERVQLSSSIAALMPAADEHRVQALARAGALEPGARAEAMVRSGRARDAAVPYARAARAALDAGLRAAAVRFAAAAAPPGTAVDSLAQEVSATMAAVATALGTAVALTPTGPVDGEAGGRARALDPIALEQAATHFAERNDAEGAARMQALAELMRGNSQRAVRISGAATRASDSGASSKGQLVAALAQGAAGDVHRAIRTALLALARARQARETGGEVAALALLSTLYRAAGRDDDARSLAEGARRLQPTAGTS